MQTKKVVASTFILLISAVSHAQNGVFQADGNQIHAQTGKPSFEVSVRPDVSPTVFRLAISNPEGKKLHVRISHRVLGAVLDTTIYSVNFYSRYNLSEVEDGRYIITVGDRKEKFRKEIEMTTISTRSLELF